MGMDGVEIVMAVEDAFDIRIEDAEVEKIVTPRQLIELVQDKVANVETEICLSHRAFNLVRRYFTIHHGLPRKGFKLTTHLDTLFPRQPRKVVLRDMALEVGTEPFPPLVRPSWLVKTLFVISVACGAYFGIRESSASIGIAVSAATGFLGFLLTQPFRNDFPKGLKTAGELALWVKRHKPDLASKSQKAWTHVQIAARVREIVIDVLGCEKIYRDDARFVQDLGLS